MSSESFEGAAMTREKFGDGHARPSRAVNYTLARRALLSSFAATGLATRTSIAPGSFNP